MKQFHTAEPGESPHGPYDEAMLNERTIDFVLIAAQGPFLHSVS